MIRTSIIGILGGVVMAGVLARKFGGETRFTIGLIGFISIVVSIIVGYSHANHFRKTITSFQYIWNGGKIKFLAYNECNDVMIKEIMTPWATYWASEIMRLETHGLDRLPIGCRQKNAAKRKIDTYVSACLGMGLGGGILTHKNLVATVFSFASKTS